MVGAIITGAIIVDGAIVIGVIVVGETSLPSCGDYSERSRLRLAAFSDVEKGLPFASRPSVVTEQS